MTSGSFGNGCTNGCVTERGRIGTFRAALHVRELIAQGRDAPFEQCARESDSMNE